MGMPQGFAKWIWAAPVVALLMTSVAPAACAQELAQSPQDLVNRELSPRTTGELKTPSDVEERSNPVPPAESFSDEDRERPVVGPDDLPPGAPLPQALPSEVLALDSNMSARVNDVLACRMEIAADRRVPVSKVKAGRVLLRWTVTPGGTVEGAEAVATGKSTDPEVLSCAKRKVEAWAFVRAPGGQPLSVQQALRFE
jgi:hypothetical protein